MSKMQMSRRQFMHLSALTAAGLAAGYKLNPLLAQDDISGTVSYIHHFTSESEFVGMENVIASFEQLYPNVSISQENIPNADYMSKFTAFVIGDARPDTAAVTTERLADMVAMNGLVDLTERVDNWALKDENPPAVWEGISQDGKIYGVPAFAFIDWMYYRKDWFDEAGMAPPTTLDEFVEAATYFTNPDEGRYGFGMRGGDGGQWYLLPILQAFGNQLPIVDGEVQVDEEKFVEALRWWTDLATVYKVVPPSVAGDSYRQIMEGFKTGQTAMMWHHTGSLAEISDALSPEQFGTFPRPMGPMGSPGNVTFQYNGVMKEDNIDAAWAWVSYWGTPDPALEFLDATGYFPANSLLAEDPRIADNPLYTAAFQALEEGQPRPSFVGLSGWLSNVLLPEFQRVIVGDSSVEDAAQAMIEGLKEATE